MIFRGREGREGTLRESQRRERRGEKETIYSKTGREEWIGFLSRCIDMFLLQVSCVRFLALVAQFASLCHEELPNSKLCAGADVLAKMSPIVKPRQIDVAVSTSAIGTLHECPACVSVVALCILLVLLSLSFVL
jgi:hypothetical protein